MEKLAVLIYISFPIAALISSLSMKSIICFWSSKVTNN
jgi:hypothetical protein